MGGGKPVRERSHRLPLDAYRGNVTVSFTACIKGRTHLFTDAPIVREFVAFLQRACEVPHCDALAYCFMPDHLHAVLAGRSPESDTWKAFVTYKQSTGLWMKRHRPWIAWQKDFYDHILRDDEDVSRHIMYIVKNPVRMGLVHDWRDCPFTGSLAGDIAEYLAGGAG